MQAYTQTITKTEFVKELRAHQKADNFISGSYWNERAKKGCAVGCSLESISRIKKIKFSFNDHSMYAKHLGIPEWLAHVEDTIFEGVSIERSKRWPVEFAEAINEGADLEKIKTPFLIFILQNSLVSIENVQFDALKFPDVKASIEQTKIAVTQMIEAQQSENAEKISAAESAAWSAARSAARSAAESAAWSAAESAAESAAWSAAWSARSAAESARSAAESAAWSARSAAYEKYADHLLVLLRGCK